MMEATEKGIHDFGIRFGEADAAIDMLGLISRERGNRSGSGSRFEGSFGEIRGRGVRNPG